MALPSFGALTYHQSNALTSGSNTPPPAEAWPDHTEVRTINGRLSLKFGRLARHGETHEVGGMVYVYQKSVNRLGKTHHTVKMLKARSRPIESRPPPPVNNTPKAWNKETKAKWFAFKSKPANLFDFRNRKLAAMAVAQEHIIDRYVSNTNAVPIPDVITYLTEFAADLCIVQAETQPSTLLPALDVYAHNLSCTAKPGSDVDGPAIYTSIREPMRTSAPGRSRLIIGTSPEGVSRSLADYIFQDEDEHEISVRMREYWAASQRFMMEPDLRRHDGCTPHVIAAAAVELCESADMSPNVMQAIGTRADEKMKSSTHAYNKISKAQWLDSGYQPGSSWDPRRLLAGDQLKAFRNKKLAALSEAATAVTQRYKSSVPSDFSLETLGALAERLTDLCRDATDQSELGAQQVIEEADKTAANLAKGQVTKPEVEDPYELFQAVRNPSPSTLSIGGKRTLADYISEGQDDRAQSSRLKRYLENLCCLAKDDRFERRSLEFRAATAVRLCEASETSTAAFDEVMKEVCEEIADDQVQKDGS